MRPKEADGMTNSVYMGQTGPEANSADPVFSGAVCSGLLTLFAQIDLSCIPDWNFHVPNQG